MVRKIWLAVTLYAIAVHAQAGLFGGSSTEKDQPNRSLEQRCAQDHSVAYCTMWANKSPFNLQDVDFPVNGAQYVEPQDKTGQITGGIAGIAVGASQLKGAAPTIGSRVGMGSLNILGSLIELTADYSQAVSDRMIGFLPESDADNPVSAQNKFERAYIDAFVNSLPGVVSATYEILPLEDGRFAYTYVLHGGECDTNQCVLWSPSWGEICNSKSCQRPNLKAKLIEHGFLGDGKFWVPCPGTFVSLVINPKKREELVLSRRKSDVGIASFKSKLDVMTEMTSKLPKSISYFLAPTTDKVTVPVPMVLNSGSQYLFIKPKQSLASNP